MHIKTVIFVVVTILLLAEAFGYVYFQYPRYSFRKKSKYESKVRRLKSQCDQSMECNGKVGLAMSKCVRMCMSQPCYEEIYGFDELEEGEIDVRYNSFKGCVLENKKLT